MIAIDFTLLAIEDVRRAREAIVEGHPFGHEAGEILADEVAARLARAIEGLSEFPRIGHAGVVPGVLEIVVPGPTRHLTFIVGYRLRGDRITVLGITWGGRTFGALGRR
ncbi:type II toxin-antitoxin system RelE/ParE family toxin [Falsiroseomonas sp. E2-1-a20]|uniref:type II toxin-antitoxin system RelE/ParE family toxin n=1 Tax=Falsiroseomonas sp. E2-1-a20 TaxID=3239300 RepID=UPI003F3EAFEC